MVLNKYRANSKIEDPNERYITTLEQLEDQLGLGDTPVKMVLGKVCLKIDPVQLVKTKLYL